MPPLIKTGMPDNVDIAANYTVQVAAIDEATGDPVTGVKVSNVTLEVVNINGGDLSNGAFVAGPYMLVPGPNA